MTVAQCLQKSLEQFALKVQNLVASNGEFANSNKLSTFRIILPFQGRTHKKHEIMKTHLILTSISAIRPATT